MTKAFMRESRFRLRFSDQAMESLYRLAEDAKALRLMRLGILAGVLVFLMGSFLTMFAEKYIGQYLPAGLSIGISTTKFWQAVVS